MHRPASELTEAKIEREVADTPEGQRLIETIFNAVQAYVDLLENRGLSGIPHRPRAAETEGTGPRRNLRFRR